MSRWQPDLMRVLVVEDKVKLAALLRRALRGEGLAADVAIRGEDALWMAGATRYAASGLDLMLPGTDGTAPTAAHVSGGAAPARRAGGGPGGWPCGGPWGAGSRSGARRCWRSAACDSIPRRARS